MKKDVVVIGGGVVGVCTAYFLWKEGRSVTVIDKGDIGKGCSFGNAGYITPSHFIPLSAPGMISKGLKWMFNPESPLYIKFRLEPEFLKWMWQFSKHCTNAHVQRVQQTLLDLNIESKKLFQEFVQNEFNFKFSDKGLLMLCNTKEGLEGERYVVNEANKLGLNARMLTANDVDDMEPELKANINGAAYFPSDAHLSPYEFVSGLRQFLESNGIEFIEQEDIQSATIEHRKITSVSSFNQTYEADEFVLTAGSWSPELGKKLALKIPVQAGKGYSITVPKTFQCDTPFIFTEGKVAVTPLGETIRFGGTMELAGTQLTLNPNRINGILKTIKRYLPTFDTDSIDRSAFWAGLRPCTPDGVPLIGREKGYKNLTIATGHAMMGLSLGPITGKLVSEILSEKEPSVSLTHTDPNRF